MSPHPLLQTRLGSTRVCPRALAHDVPQARCVWAHLAWGLARPDPNPDQGDAGLNHEPSEWAPGSWLAEVAG